MGRPLGGRGAVVVFSSDIRSLTRFRHVLKIPIHQYWNLLATYLTPQRNQVLGLAVLVLSSIGLQLLNPQVIRYFIDTASSGGAQSALLLAAALYIGFSL